MTVVYTLTIIAFHTTLSIQEVMGAEAVAVVSFHLNLFALNFQGSFHKYGISVVEKRLNLVVSLAYNS